MKSKEEIVSEVIKRIRRQISNYGSNYACGHTDGLSKAAGIVKLHMPFAMSEYASQVSVGFAEYINEGIWAKYESGLWYPFEPQDDDTGLTTEQLFTQYLKTIEQ